MTGVPACTIAGPPGARSRNHRNGILLAPITADAVAHMVLEGEVDPAIAPFGFELILYAKVVETHPL